MRLLQIAKLRSLLINRDFALLLGGDAVSCIGDYVFGTTLILWVAVVIAPGQSWAPLAVSGVALAGAIPTLLVGPFAGVFTDRWNKRTTMLWMDATRAVLIATLLVAARGGLPIAWQLGMIYGVIFLASVCSQFFSPSILILVGDIVPAADRARASAMSQAASSLALMIGPPLAAPLLFSVGVQWAIVVDSLSFAVSFLAVRALHVATPDSGDAAETPADQQGATFLREFRAGIQFFLHNTVLTTILSTLAIVVLGGAALSTLNVFFLIDELHTPDSMFGFLGMVGAVGGIAGALLAAVLAPRIGAVRCYWLALLVAGLLMLGYAQLTTFASALVVLTLLSVVDSVPEVALGPLILQATPREFLGRVSGVIQPSLSAVRMLSAVLVGFLASAVLRGFHAHLLVFTFDPVITIFSGAGILVLVGGVYAMVTLRGIVVASPAPGDVE